MYMIKDIIVHLKKIESKISNLKESIYNDIYNENTTEASNKTGELNMLLNYRNQLNNWFIHDTTFPLRTELEDNNEQSNS